LSVAAPERLAGTEEGDVYPPEEKDRELEERKEADYGGNEDPPWLSLDELHVGTRGCHLRDLPSSLVRDDSICGDWRVWPKQGIRMGNKYDLDRMIRESLGDEDLTIELGVVF
jgi:hypothetical protein